MGELRNEIARLRPQMELATENYCKASRDFRKSASEQQKKFREDALQEREQLRKQERQLRMQLDQMRRGMRGNLLLLRDRMEI